MIEQLGPIGSELKLAQLLGDDFVSEQTTAVNSMSQSPAEVKFSGNIFEDVLSSAIDSLEGISRAEVQTNQMIDKYLKGEVELQEVMVAQSKMSIVVQLAVTTINSAVTSFKEIIQMQV